MNLSPWNRLGTFRIPWPMLESASAMQHGKSVDPHPLDKKAEDNRVEQIRNAAAERHRKSDTDGTRRRARQKAEDNRLI